MEKKTLIQKHAGTMLVLGPIAIAAGLFYIIKGIMLLISVNTNTAGNVALSMASLMGIATYVLIAVWEMRNTQS